MILQKKYKYMIKKIKELHYISYVAFYRLSERIYKYTIQKRRIQIKKWSKNRLNNFTLAKFIGAVLTITAVSLVKYWISGSFHLEYNEFWSNIVVGLLGWTINNAIIDWLTQYWEIKGINFNLYQFLFGFDTMNAKNESRPENFKPKLYYAMELDDNGKGLDKGKGIDRDNFEGETKSNDNAEIKSLDKGKGIDRTVHPFYGQNIGNDSRPPFATWFRLNPGMDPASVFFPQKINPGPGFNVPGGEVPIRDEICKHIDYNTHILSQFKKMDLKTAIQQRDNNLNLIKIMQEKLDFANNALSKVPTIPTTEYEFKLKNQILKDLDELNRNKVRAEARATLLNSRIQFIEIKINSNK